MGGPAAVGPGRAYALKGVDEMVPGNLGSPGVKVSVDKVRFLDKAPSHPILKLDENPKRNEELWAKLPPLDGVTLLPSSKPGATVLGTVNVQVKEYPVMTVWKIGEGRVAGLTTRTTWGWSLVPRAKESL